MNHDGEWYRDRRDGLWTLDLDVRASVNVAIGWDFPAPVLVEVLTPVAEGGSVDLDVVSVDAAGAILSVAGAGAKVPLKISYGTRDPQEHDIVTLRFRARES